MTKTNYINSQFQGSVPTIFTSHPFEMLHSYREVSQTFPAYRKGNGSPPLTSAVDCSSEFLGRPGSQHKPKLKSQLVSQTINARSDGDKGLSLLPLIWVEVRDNIIPPHAVPFASDGRGPLFIARANVEGTFFLGKAGPQLTSGAIISYGSLDITVTRYEVLVCAGQLSWEIPHSTGTGFLRQDTVVTKYVNYDLEPALMYHQDIPEDAHNHADIFNGVDTSQRLATSDLDPDPPVVASNTRIRPRARSNSRYGLSPNESLDVDIRKAYDTFIPLKSLELTERSRSLPPRARTSADSSFDARAELGSFRCDSAQSAGVTTAIMSATRRLEYAPVSRQSVVASSKPRVRLDCATGSQESHRLPTVVSAVEYSASERDTPVGSFGRSEISGFREVANVDGWSEYSSPPPEPPAHSVHAGFVQDVLPLRRYPNTTSASVDHRTNQFSPTSATSHSLASNAIDLQFTNLSNPSPKNDSQFTPAHYSFPSHQMSSESLLPQPSTVSSRGAWAGTPGSPVLCLCTFDDVKDTSRYHSKLANCPIHPATDTTGISSSSGDFGHVDQYDQWTYPASQAHACQRGTQHQKHHSNDSPSRVPQPPTFPSTDSPLAQSSLVGDHADVDLCSTPYPRHGVPKSPTETSYEDGNTTASECGCGSEHVCDSEHWQLVSRTTFGIEAQACDSVDSDAVASTFPAPITINPSNAGIVTGDVKLRPYPVPHITSVTQMAGNNDRGHSRVAVKESALEREPTHKYRVAGTTISKTTSTEAFTSAVPCRGALVAEGCVPLSTVAFTPNLPPSLKQSVSCSDGSVTDDKLHGHHEYADSSCASAAPEEGHDSTPTQSRVIAAENTREHSQASIELRNSSFTKSTLTTAESSLLTADEHDEPYGQNVARGKPSQVSSTPELTGGEEDLSTDRKRQALEGREDHHEKGTESEVKPNLTSYPHTVRIFEGHAPESAILSDDRPITEDTDAALSLSSANPGSKVIPFEPRVPQDSGTIDIKSGYEHRSVDVDTVSKSSIQISSHDSTESSEGHIQRHDEGHERVDSMSVPVSLAPAEDIGASAPHRAVEDTQKSSPASNDIRDSSLPEDTWMTSQTSPVTDLKGGSCGQFVDMDLPTQGSSTPNVYVKHDKVPVSTDCMHQDLEGRGDYHARVAESDVTIKSKSNFSTVESLRQSESVIVSNAGGQSDEATNSDVSSPSSTFDGRRLSLSEPGVPQDAGINYIQSTREHQSSEIDIATTTLVQTSSHRSIENRVQSSVVTIQEGPCSQDVATDQPCQHSSALKLDSNELAECTHQAVESRGGRHESEPEGGPKLSSTAYSHSVRTVEQSTSETAILDEDKDITTSPLSPMTRLPPSDPGIPQDAGANFTQSGSEHQSSGVDTTSITIVQTSVDVSAGYAHQASVTREDYHEQETKSEVETNVAYHVCSVEMLGQSSSDTVTGNSDRRMDEDANDTALPPSSTIIRPKLSNSEPDIPQDAATSSKVITVLTTSMQASSQDSIVRSEHVQAFSCSDEPPIGNTVNESQTATPVHPCLTPGEKNSTPAQPFGVAYETMQQPSPAPNNITGNLSEGVSTTGQASTNECGEPCGRDGTGDLPSQGSSTPKLKDDKEEISADYTCQVIEDIRNYKSDTTGGQQKESGASAKVTVLPLSSPNLGPEGPPSEPSVQQCAVTNLVQSEREHHVTEDITVSAMSVHASSNCLTDSSNGCAHLDNSSQQSNKCPGMISILPMHDGPCSPPSTSCGVYDSLDCSCASREIASPVSNVGDCTPAVACGAANKAISSDDDHPAPCAKGTPGVKLRQDSCTKAEPTLVSMTCDSNTVQTSSQTENRDNPSSAADTRLCDAQGSACVTVSILSDDCRACTATTATDCCPVADKQLTQTATTDCAHEPCSTNSLPTKLC